LAIAGAIFFTDEWFDWESMTVINGSRAIKRDLFWSINLWGLTPLPKVEPIPIDETGTPYHFCCGGHYAPRRAFYKDTRRKTGLRGYCKACEHERYEASKATAPKVSVQKT